MHQLRHPGGPTGRQNAGGVCRGDQALLFFPGAHPVRSHAKELKAYDTSKGTVRFSVERPLPAALVSKLVKTRIAQYAAEKQNAARKVKRRA